MKKLVVALLVVLGISVAGAAHAQGAKYNLWLIYCPMTAPVSSGGIRTPDCAGYEFNWLNTYGVDYYGNKTPVTYRNWSYAAKGYASIAACQEAGYTTVVPAFNAAWNNATPVAYSAFMTYCTTDAMKGFY